MYPTGQKLLHNPDEAEKSELPLFFAILDSTSAQYRRDGIPLEKKIVWKMRNHLVLLRYCPRHQKNILLLTSRLLLSLDL